MKKLVLLIAFLLVSSTCVFATPVYMGSTTGDSFAVNPPLPAASGYYIWSNDDRTSWSMRWTGNENSFDYNSSLDRTYSWSGFVEFLGNDLVSYDTFNFNESGETVSSGVFMGIEYVSYDTDAGWHWDGFDFTLAGQYGDKLRFNLTGSLFDDLSLGNDQLSSGIYIGDSYSPAFVDAVDIDGANYQRFEVNAPVPEPATLLLLGSGLVGLAFLKRRKS